MGRLLKGQCHEVVVETKDREPFFPQQNRPFQSYSLYSSTSIYVKTSSPDPADFAMTWHLIHWRVLALRAMVGATFGISQPSQHDMPTDLKLGLCKIRQNLQAVAYWAKSLGISRCDSCDMPTVAQQLCEWPQSAN
jgi:hypothetical protein